MFFKLIHRLSGVQILRKLVRCQDPKNLKHTNSILVHSEIQSLQDYIQTLGISGQVIKSQK